MIDIRVARESYGYGAAVARDRKSGDPGTPKAPAQIDQFFYNLGEDDASAGRIRNFDGATAAASTGDEQNAYDVGFDGGAPPSNPALRLFWDAGRVDRAEGRLRTWTTRAPIRVAPPAPGPTGPAPTGPAPIGPAPTGGYRPAPPYVPNTPAPAPGPVVVVNPPPARGGYPPPRRIPRRSRGLVISGPWGSIDLSLLFNGAFPV